MWLCIKPLIVAVNVKDADIQNPHPYAVYHIEFRNVDGMMWSVEKRFSDFVKFHVDLQYAGGILPSLPSKTLLPSVNVYFLHRRRNALQVYLESILDDPHLARHQIVHAFLKNPVYDYWVGLKETAVRLIKEFILDENEKEDHQLTHVCDLPHMGYFFGKAYTLCENENGGTRIVLAVQPHSTVIDWNTDANVCCRLLRLLYKHPYLNDISFLDYVPESNLFVLSSLCYSSSLKDLICDADALDPYIKKYQKKGKGLPIHLIQLYGRQILEALSYLLVRSYPYGQLHTGNILINNNKIKLAGLESSFLGREAYLDTRYPRADLSSINFRNIDILSFGHVLFEMEFGMEPEVPHPKYIPPYCNSELRPILEKIFFGWQREYPTVKELISTPFFQAVEISEKDDIALRECQTAKLTTKMKDLTRKGRSLRISDQKPSRAEVLSRYSCDETAAEESLMEASKMVQSRGKPKRSTQKTGESSNSQPGKSKTALDTKKDPGDSRDPRAPGDPATPKQEKAKLEAAKKTGTNLKIRPHNYGGNKLGDGSKDSLVKLKTVRKSSQSKIRDDDNELDGVADESESDYSVPAISKPSHNHSNRHHLHHHHHHHHHSKSKPSSSSSQI